MAGNGDSHSIYLVLISAMFLVLLFVFLIFAMHVRISQVEFETVIFLVILPVIFVTILRSLVESESDESILVKILSLLVMWGFFIVYILLLLGMISIPGTPDFSTIVLVAVIVALTFWLIEVVSMSTVKFVRKL